MEVSIFWCFVNHLGTKHHLLYFISIVVQADMPDWKSAKDKDIAHLCCSKFPGTQMYFSFFPAIFAFFSLFEQRKILLFKEKQ